MGSIQALILSFIFSTLILVEIWMFYQETALHLACKNGFEKVVKLLLDWKADVTLGILNGTNALSLAIDGNNEECVAAFIESPSWKESLRNATVTSGPVIGMKLFVSMNAFLNKESQGPDLGP